MISERVGDYETIAELGQGTVGTVFRAKHLRTGEPAAIKILQVHLSREPDVQRRFVREVAICEKLNHPNIVRHLDCGLHSDQIYFAMELVNCGTLKEVLRRRQKLPWREVAECGVQICSALAHAHALGIIHRDLKPANLFLSGDGRIKIGDFGLARDLHSARLTAQGQTVGTCRYMPPEQIRGEEDLTGAVDLYALGCILYEMLVGRTPFDGETIVAIFEQHLNETPLRLNSLVPDCPEDLADLVSTLLAKNPLDRPRDAAIVEAALTDILRGRPMDAKIGAERVDSTFSTSPSAGDAPNLTQRLHGGNDRNEWMPAGAKWAVIVGMLAALAAVGFLLARLR